MNSGVEDFGFGLVSFLGFLHLNCFVGFFFPDANTVFKLKYLPLPDTPVRAL